MIRACILGLAGKALSAEEAAFLGDARPWGFILFGRNVDNPDQLRKLISDLRETVGRSDVPVLVDQEGGRVQRLGPPHWRRYPPGSAYGSPEDARRGARLIAHDLAAIGINVDCAPVADVPAPGSHEVIGDRAFSPEPARVAEMARAQAEGLLAGGVMPVVKHIPGHGRATADSHLALPRVDASLDALEARDLVPFRALADLPAAMTAHVIYSAVDPKRPATTSRAVIDRVIRGAIGFDGLLMSDDLEMKALTGSLGERAEAALSAGCDVVLQCHGGLGEMAEVVKATGPLDGRAEVRATAALARIAAGPKPFDAAAEAERFEAAFA